MFSSDDHLLQVLPREPLDADEPVLNPEGWSGLAEHYLNGDLDLVYDAKRRDWMSLKHWTFLAQRRNATEVTLKNLF